MKYLAIGEFNIEDLERISELWKEHRDERDRRTGKFPNTEQLLFDGHTLHTDLPKKTKDLQGFHIFETEDKMHLMNYVMHYSPYMNLKFIPITSNIQVAKSWMGWKK